MGTEDPGGFEFFYEFVMTPEERDQYDRDEREAEEAAAAEKIARLADLERRWAAVGADIFGRPFAPLQAELEHNLDLEAELQTPRKSSPSEMHLPRELSHAKNSGIPLPIASPDKKRRS